MRRRDLLWEGGKDMRAERFLRGLVDFREHMGL